MYEEMREGSPRENQERERGYKTVTFSFSFSFGMSRATTIHTCTTYVCKGTAHATCDIFQIQNPNK